MSLSTSLATENELKRVKNDIKNEALRARP